MKIQDFLMNADSFFQGLASTIITFITNGINSLGLNISEGFTRIILVIVLVLLILLSFKIGKLALKIFFIILGIFLIVGFLLPSL